MPSRANIEPKSPSRDAFASSPAPSEYDAIAELFLGAIDYAPATTNSHNTSDPHDPHDPHESRDPREWSPPPLARVQSGDPLTRSTIKPLADPAGGQMIEAIVLGHLPGAAAPWASQYAAALATSLDAPVGLIRIAEGELSVELVGETDDSLRTASVDEAIGRVRLRCQRFVVRSDTDDESTLQSARRIDRITILTGANEAAVVAAYRTIKRLSTNPPTGFHSRFGIAFMGADEDEARRAMSRLSGALAEIEHVELIRTPGVHRLGPVLRTTLIRAPFSGSARAIESLLTRPMGDPIEAPICNTTSPPLGPSLATSLGPPQAQPSDLDACSEETPADSASILGSATLVVDETPPERWASTPAEPVLTVTPSADPEPPAAPRVLSLASRLVGMLLLESRCPYHDSVELAVDDAGRLHLLTVGALDRLGELIAVECWARDHALLLAKAGPMLTAADPSAILHLFTDVPASVSAILHSDIRIHVLARAAADGFVCLPLNHNDCEC